MIPYHGSSQPIRLSKGITQYDYSYQHVPTPEAMHPLFQV